MSYTRLVIVVTLALVSTLASGYDPAPTQDFCVAVDDSDLAVVVNGKYCKNPNLVTAEDFFYPGLLVTPEDTTTYYGTTRVTYATVKELPGLNTMGLSMARTEFGPFAMNLPHYHPRASEILVVVEGSLEVGFHTSDPENRLINKILEAGDVFVFPVGLAHSERNIGRGNAVAISAFSCQNPGVVTLDNTTDEDDDEDIAYRKAKDCEGNDCSDQKKYNDEL